MIETSIDSLHDAGVESPFGSQSSQKSMQAHNGVETRPEKKLQIAIADLELVAEFWIKNKGNSS